MPKLPIIQQTFDFILNQLFPPQCVHCRAAAAHFCANCQLKITKISEPVCAKCGYPYGKGQSHCRQCQTNPLYFLDSIRSVAFFDDSPLKTAIHKFKYNNYQALGGTLAPLLADCYTANGLNTDVLVPVPLHKSRYKERGYNQSTILAHHLSALIDRPVNDKTLVRHRVTRTQMTLKASERKENVANAFVCQTNALENKSILLIDDVCTTGATLDACAQALKQAKAHRVYGLTLARAI